MAHDDATRRDVTAAQDRERFLILRALILERIADLERIAEPTPVQRHELRVLSELRDDWLHERLA